MIVKIAAAAAAGMIDSWYFLHQRTKDPWELPKTRNPNPNPLPTKNQLSYDRERTD